jgi:mRNA interferase MazF
MASVDDLWLVDFGDPFPGETAWHRPALVLGPPATFGEGFPFVIVLPLSTTDRGLSLHVEVEANEQTGLDQASFVLCEQIRSVNRRRLVHRVGSVAPETSARVTGIVRTLLDL